MRGRYSDSEVTRRVITEQSTVTFTEAGSTVYFTHPRPEGREIIAAYVR